MYNRAPFGETGVNHTVKKYLLDIYFYLNFNVSTLGKISADDILK